MCSPSMLTAAVPRSMIQNRSPGSPCSITVAPAGTVFGMSGKGESFARHRRQDGEQRDLAEQDEPGRRQHGGIDVAQARDGRPAPAPWQLTPIIASPARRPTVPISSGMISAPVASPSLTTLSTAPNTRPMTPIGASRWINV